MASSIEEMKRDAERMLELLQELQHAETQDERDRLVQEMKALTMKQLGVKGTA